MNAIVRYLEPLARPLRRGATLLAALTGGATLGIAQTTIGLDFVGGQSGASTTTMSSTESAGVVSQTNWNNLSGASGTDTTVRNSSGTTVSGLTVTYSSTNTWADAGVTNTAGNLRMMRGYLDINTNGASTTVSVSGLASLGYYDVYVYAAGDGTNRVGEYTIGNQTYWTNDNSTFSGTFTRSTAETDPGGYQNATAGNYMVFSDLTGNSVSLTATGAYAADGTLRAPVNGIQIVQLPTLYWDLNGSTTGAGGTSPSGTWNTSTKNWSSASAGTAATTTWSSGNLAVFSAGTDATGSYTVTVSGTQTASSLIVEEGRPTFTSGVITLNGTTPQLNVAAGSTTTINSQISSSAGLYKTGGGTLVVGSTANSWSGPTVVRAGTLTSGAANALPSGTDLTVESGATFNLNSYTQTIDALSGAGMLQLAGGTLIVGSANSSSTFSGSFASGDTGTLQKNGTGTLTFGAGMNLAGGNLVLNGGTLALGGFTSTFSTLTVTANSTLDFSGLSVLNVGSLAVNSGVTLTVTNWADTVDFFYSLFNPGSANLGRIVFAGFSAGDTKWNSFDQEITPVPEPAVYGAVFMLVGFAVCFCVRLRSKVVSGQA